MKKKDEIKVCLVGSSGGHLTHLYMLKPFWKDKNRFWVTFDKEDTERVRIEESGTKTDVTRLISARMATEFERGLYYGKNE